jgi:hypothetical protein
MGSNIIILMNIIVLTKKINDGKNLIFYNKSVYNCYEELQDDYISIYFNEPTPIKVRLIKIINQLSDDSKLSLNRLTIDELKEILVKELKYERLVIIFNHFERLTKRTVQVYQYLNTLNNIQFICSFSQDFKPEIYPFFKRFELVNQEEYEEKGVKNEINVTYAVYILVSVYCFFIYLKTASSLYMAFILIGAAWFALIIFRTLVYVGGRS